VAAVFTEILCYVMLHHEENSTRISTEM
jgi:hypothetical protein